MDLNTRMDELYALKEPRENSYLRFERSACSSHPSISDVVEGYGRVATSRTLPSLSTLILDTDTGYKPVTHIRTTLTLQTMDYTGNLQTTGGDPVEATVTYEKTVDIMCDVTDNDNGTYTISFTPLKVGKHLVQASIFGRDVGTGTLVEVCGSHNPHKVYGSKGTGHENLSQPAAIVISYRSSSSPEDEKPMSKESLLFNPNNKKGLVYVADTGNSRIKVLDENLNFKYHLTGDTFNGRSVTGICVTENNTIMVVNWRTQTVSELTQDGQIIRQFTHNFLQEPTSITVSDGGMAVVADGFKVHVFDYSASHSRSQSQSNSLPNSPTKSPMKAMSSVPTGKLLYSWGAKGNKDGEVGPITALCWVPPTGDSSDSEGEIVIADSRLQVFSVRGTYIRSIRNKPSGSKSSSGSSGKVSSGSYGGVTLDGNRLLLASRQDKGSACVQIFDYSLATLIFTIDSTESRLKRPAGLATTTDGWLLVLDIGGCCVKRFRYR